MLIDLIAGARPNFMKIAPIVRAIEAHAASGGALGYRLIHTGQHYDRQMSDAFFEQLEIPNPDINLEVGSGTQAEQTGAIMQRYEAVLMQKPSQLCLVVGDVTSTMACAITAKKMHIAVAHVEGGIRSGDRRMPEEINRLVTDAITDWYFTTSAWAGENLRREGAREDQIRFVGNTMVDTLLHHMKDLRKPLVFDYLGLSEKNYFVMTLHRPSNVDDDCSLRRLLVAIRDGAQGRPVIFPVHPRTSRTLERIGGVPNGLHMIDAQPYLEFNWLVKNALGVITDSGGITEEATVMNIPCITLRDTTERPETIEIGSNELVGDDVDALKKALMLIYEGKWKKSHSPEKWDGKAAERIVADLELLL